MQTCPCKKPFHIYFYRIVRRPAFSQYSDKAIAAQPTVQYGKSEGSSSWKPNKPAFMSSISQLDLDPNMRDRDFMKLDRKKLHYEDIVKFKWKTIQYLVENK